MGGPPAAEPIGLQLARTAKVVRRAFDDALARVGGSLPTWLVLVSLTARRHGAQRELADAVGVEGPTLSHHLNRMEAAGLITRTRDPANRRVHQVELTEAGEATLQRLLGAVTAFDQQLGAASPRRSSTRSAASSADCERTRQQTRLHDAPRRSTEEPPPNETIGVRIDRSSGAP